MTATQPVISAPSTLRAVADELRRPTNAREALDMRVAAVQKVVYLLRQRLSHPNELALLERAQTIAERAGQRLALSSAHTVVALAGSTGSGKSSLFNALAGLELSTVGVRRPTTSFPYACVWGPQGAEELLDWLEIAPEHRTARESVLDADAEADLRGLILLDLPDHDSALVGHRLQVDRLVQLVDILIWVVDPQKYADAALHQQYLRKLAHHHEIVVITLNQVDQLSETDRQACLADLRRLIAADGLDETRVLATSATQGTGLGDLRKLLVAGVHSRQAAPERLEADINAIGVEFQAFSGNQARIDIDRDALGTLHSTIANAVGVTAIADAVGDTYRRRAIGYTSWPLTRGLARLRLDPVRRLLVGLGELDQQTANTDQRNAERTVYLASKDPNLAVEELAQNAAVHTVQVESAIRELADHASVDLPPPWPGALRSAALSRAAELPNSLAEAVAGAQLASRRTPSWWRAVNIVQWLGFIALIVGAVWLLAGSIATIFDNEISTPMVGRVSLPVILVLGGLIFGPLLALICRMVIRRGQRIARERARSTLTEVVTSVTREKVLTPLRTELTFYADTRDAINTVTGDYVSSS